MNRSYLLPVAIAAIFVAGCASVDSNSAEPRSENRRVTGSHIPASDGSTSAEIKAIEGKDIDEIMQRRGISGSMPGKGGAQ